MPKHHPRRSDDDNDADDGSSSVDDHRRRNRNDDGSDSAILSNNGGGGDDDRRRKKHSSKHKKRSSKSGSSSSKRKDDKKKHKSSSKKDSKKRSRRRHKDDEEDDSASHSNDDDTDSSEQSESRRKKKHKKERKKRSKRPRREKETDNDDGGNEHTVENYNPTISASTGSPSAHILTQALCHLFTVRPVFAQELPILLIRLTGGSTFDLKQMNDHVAATALEAVLECLKEYGVQYTNGEWLFQAPPGIRDERALLRVIRSLLDEVGVTMRAVGTHETKLAEEAIRNANTKPAVDEHTKTTNAPEDPAIDRIKDLTSTVILKYQEHDAELGAQFAGLCQTIATGESISIDGLPDDTLKAALEGIFVACGLEKSEMVDENDDSEDCEDNNDDKDDDENAPTMGYCLPEGAGDAIQVRLAAVMEACRNPVRKVLGPMRPTPQEAATTYNSEDEDEGPAMPGQERRRPRGPVLPDHVIKAEAEYRELVLKATAAGMEIPTHAGGREEWMIIPGKFDFMSNIKSGQPMKSRGFQNKKTRGGDDDAPEVPIHPAIQAEMDAILQAHQDARGPSLMDQHRSKRQQEKLQEATSGKDQGWKWSRDKDLDEGRRVDKDALHMVLGGAKTNLKTKFHGGFN